MSYEILIPDKVVVKQRGTYKVSNATKIHINHKE